ncbi:hypothetical protein EJ08DRAFT_45347 [Tothia fuscella]|uniref:Uncharacterized protein n=1 Tax=Tothia fuscella TaxID=1048955 RepID=A0A9P4TTB3_9PEZI|nr:hypothetical protein EJ08DRAFT_45347 [Tothia fuscella]
MKSLNLIFTLTLTLLTLTTATPLPTTNNDTDINPSDPLYAILPSTTFNASTISTADTKYPPATEFGVAIDLCYDRNFQRCTRNMQSGPRRCVNLIGDGWRNNGLSSIGFVGNMMCQLHTGFDCTTNWGWWIDVHRASADLRGYGVEDKVLSYWCVRIS